MLVLNWNGRPFLQECLSSLKEQDYEGFETVLVDNGSTDGSADYVRDAFPRVRIFSLPENLGFCGANNKAIQESLSRGIKYVLLLNNDTFVAPRFVREIIKAAEDDPEVAVVCPKIFWARRPNVFWYAGADLNLWLGRARHRGYNQEDHGQFDSRTVITLATGCAMLVRCSAIAEVGMLNEDLWAYAEDLEWGLRFQQAGYKLRFAPTARVWHYDGSTNVVAGSQAIRLYYSTRNLLHIGMKYCRWWQVPTFLLGFLIFHLAFFFALRLMRSDYPALVALYAGVRDALRGSMQRYRGAVFQPTGPS